MKHTFKFISLVLFILCINRGTVIAQCTPIIGINPPSLQNGYLIFSGYGVNSTAFAECWGEVNPDNTQWMALQNVIIPNPCTACLVVYQIDLRTLNFGQVLRFRVKMFDSLLYASDVVTYRVVHKRHHDAIDRIISGSNPDFNSLQLNGPLVINSTSNTGEPTNLDPGKITNAEFPPIIDIGEYDLERISDSESTTNASLDNVDVTVDRNSISISNHEDCSLYFTLHAIDGRVVNRSKGEIQGNTNTQITPENLPAGIYILTMTSSTGGMKSKKIIISE